MYDWANSAFWSTVVTAVFPPFFSTYAAAGLTPVEATTRFAWATTIAAAIIAVLGPVLGAIADYRGWKKRLLAVCVALGVTATLLMVAIERGNWLFAAIVFMLGNIGVATSLVFYDSLLPHIARPHEIDRVSTAGFAIGFLGGGIVLLLNLAWILSPATFGLPDTVAAIKLSFVSVAVWWAVFSIPLLRRVPEPPVVLGVEDTSGASPVRVAFRRVRTTFHELRDVPAGVPDAGRLPSLQRRHPDDHPDGVDLRRRGRHRPERTDYRVRGGAVRRRAVLVPVRRARRSHRRETALFGALTVYTVIALLGYFMTTALHFFVLAFLVGMVQGGSQALSRSLFARMIPKHKSSEYFGFYSVFEKFAGVAGPAVFALSVTLSGSSRVAVLSVIGFFVAGALVLDTC